MGKAIRHHSSDEWIVRSLGGLEEIVKHDESESNGMRIVVVGGGDLIHHILSVLKYPQVVKVRFSYAQLPVSDRIIISDFERRTLEGTINRQLAGDRDILMCQDELIEAGLAEWAKL